MLGSYIKQRAYDEIIYIDETTFNLWQKTSKCWLVPGMKLSMLKTRGPSITVIGAISKERGLVHVNIIDESNNAEHFQHFLVGLKSKCEGRRVVLILDNLRIHHANMLNDTYTADFKEMFLPPYSSTLNPIEVLWSMVKRRWAKNLYRFTEEIARSNSLASISKRTMEELHCLIGNRIVDI